MRKFVILFTLLALSCLKIAAGRVDEPSKISSHIKKLGSYLASSKGAKDFAFAYCLGMGLTTIHELGHAVTGKMLFGDPIRLSIGASSSKKNHCYTRIGEAIKIEGFNPATAYATLKNHNDQPLKMAIIYAAGPVAGALSSLATYLLLKKYDGLYIAKAAALFGLFNHTIGIAGIGGAWTPGTDTNRVVQI